MSKSVLLSFDVEEFDTPLAYSASISIAEQIRISAEGLRAVLDLLKKYEIPATFYCTAFFAQQQPLLMRRVADDGHEIASHGFYHLKFSKEDYLLSKKELESITKTTVTGFRMAQMQGVDYNLLKETGYQYDSSLSPTWLPGRYNNFNKPASPHLMNGITEIPASVATFLRVPLFWLSFHHFSKGLYRWLCRRAMKKYGYLNIYFHPWEFYPLNKYPSLNLPYLIRHNSGEVLQKRLEEFIMYCQKMGYEFKTTREYNHQITGYLQDK